MKPVPKTQAGIQPAKTLDELAANAILLPLPPGDVRYADLSTGRSSADLSKLKQHIKNCRTRKDYAIAALTGHRGCGKSTELKRLLVDFQGEFETFYVEVDPTIERNCDYPELFLWLVDTLVRRLADLGVEPKNKVVENVLRWFDEKYTERDVITHKSVALDTEAEAKAGLSLFGYGLSVLARIKSSLSGSVETRIKVRRNVEQYADSLIGNINILLHEVSQAFKAKGRSGELLIVVDNLDRMEPEPGRNLFITNGEHLKKLHAHVIYTVPIATALAPYPVAQVFKHFTIPTIDPAKPAGLHSLLDLLAHRIDIAALFQPPTLAAELAQASGGSLRDLIRLLDYAQLEAQVTNGQVIQPENVRRAIIQLREDYKRSLIPSGTYFPLLARIHQTGRDGLAELAGDEQQKIENARRFFRELLTNGAVLEYNGEDSHFAIHPVVQQIEAFKHALAQIEPPPAGRAPAPKQQRPTNPASGKRKRR